MPVSQRREQIAAHDGGRFEGLVTLPEPGQGNGILLLQEIFGVNEYIGALSDRLAGLGYVVLAPDLYWRIEPNIALPHNEETLQQAIALAQRFDFPNGVRDCGAALEHLRGLPEVGDGVGVVGFCFGGTLAHHVGAQYDPDVVVSYYGSGVPDALDLAEQMSCPSLYHFGGDDSYIPRERVEAAREVLSRRPSTEFYIYDGAAHAFDNPSPMFHVPEAAAAAWERTADFLRRNL